MRRCGILSLSTARAHASRLLAGALAEVRHYYQPIPQSGRSARGLDRGCASRQTEAVLEFWMTPSQAAMRVDDLAELEPALAIVVIDATAPSIGCRRGRLARHGVIRDWGLD